MSKKPDFLAMPEPWNLVAGGYAETTMVMLAQYAEQAIEVSNLKSDDKVLDVACGPGTLSLLVAERVASVHAIDFSEKMLSLLDQKIDDAGLDYLHTHHGDGQALPYDAESFDAAVQVQRVRKHFPVESVKAFWYAMVKGSAPITMMKQNMAKAEWAEKEWLALHYLHEQLPNMPTSLSSDAWLGTGIK